MHEMGIALEVYRTCRETVEAHGGGRLKQARIEVGELSAVEPELLVYAWEAVVEEGPDVGAELIIEWHPADQRCASSMSSISVSRRSRKQAERLSRHHERKPG
ncbi:MAG: hydrogenase maturation nickel metallochaperone HypA [Acidobacteria bacterium]|nr:hydrogenase maturation nickel metallochaperone HypA [Candidatus Sulfomarinibacter kjeldsenii]